MKDPVEAHSVKRSIEDTRSLVDPTLGLRHFELHRFEPEPPLDRFVDRFWIAQWDLDEPFEQQVLSFPAVHIIFEDGEATISTLWREEFVRRLEGEGQVVGVMFRSGGFEPFLQAPVSSISERRLDIDEVFGTQGLDVARSIFSAGQDLEQIVSYLSAFLEPLAPTAPTVGETMSEVVELMLADPSLGRVDDLATRLGTSPRQVQRLFARYVGANPKFVIQRARVQLAAEAAQHHDTDWARLATELGYSDQAHLTRSFKAEVGTSPAAYRRRLGR